MAPETVTKQELSWNLQQGAQWQPFRHAVMNFGINSHNNRLMYYVFSDMRLFTLMITVHNSFTFIKLNYIHNYAYCYAITADSLCVYFITYSQRAV